jgi:serine/threonine-protein kinase RsbW
VTKTPGKHKMVLVSIPASLEKVYTKILPDLENYGYSQDDIFGIHLSLEEAFTNAVRHGNKMDPDKKVFVEYEITNQVVKIAIEDQGEGFVPEKVPDPTEGDNIYKANGRGIYLVNAYMDKVEYEKSGTRVKLVKYKSN